MTQPSAQNRESDMLRIVGLLAETYTDDGIVIVLCSRHARLSPDRPLIEACRAPEGRARVLEWAESLTGMVAT